MNIITSTHKKNLTFFAPFRGRGGILTLTHMLVYLLVNWIAVQVLYDQYIYLLIPLIVSYQT